MCSPCARWGVVRAEIQLKKGRIQLRKAHCDSAWPNAANAAIRAYLHRAFDVIPEVDATSALGEFSRMRREGQLYKSHEALVNEVSMYAELRRARPRWGADEHE